MPIGRQRLGAFVWLHGLGACHVAQHGISSRLKHRHTVSRVLCATGEAGTAFQPRSYTQADAPHHSFCPDGVNRPAGEPSLFLQPCASRTDHAAAMCLLQTTHQPSLTAPVCPSLQSEPHANDCAAPHCLPPLCPTQHLPPNHGLASQAHGDCQSTGRCTGYTRAHWQHTSDHVSRRPRSVWPAGTRP